VVRFPRAPRALQHEAAFIHDNVAASNIGGRDCMLELRPDAVVADETLVAAVWLDLNRGLGLGIVSRTRLLV
jgi:hypothetical protein